MIRKLPVGTRAAVSTSWSAAGTAGSSSSWIFEISTFVSVMWVVAGRSTDSVTVTVPEPSSTTVVVRSESDSASWSPPPSIAANDTTKLTVSPGRTSPPRARCGSMGMLTSW